MAHHWHVAQTIPRAELAAEEHLKQQGFVPFAPRYRTTKIARGQRVITERPYFGAYLFVNFDPEQDRWQSINSTFGIRALLYAAPERPARVPDTVMRTIIDQCDGEIVRSHDLDQELAKVVWVGATVRIIAGPFTGHVGPVRWTQHDRVKVLMTILGAQREVLLPSRSVALA